MYVWLINSKLVDYKIILEMKKFKKENCMFWTLENFNAIDKKGK